MNSDFILASGIIVLIIISNPLLSTLVVMYALKKVHEFGYDVNDFFHISRKRPRTENEPEEQNEPEEYNMQQ